MPEKDKKNENSAVSRVARVVVNPVAVNGWRTAAAVKKAAGNKAVAVS